MKTLNIEIDKSIETILKKFNEALSKKEEFELGFNIFSLVSDTYYKENFHSEIVYSFLNLEGKHKKGSLYLNLFLEYLEIHNRENKYKTGIKVYNEIGIDKQRRIDLLLHSNSHAVIIENKMNNAIDMENQLVDYYLHCKKENLEVDAILYWSVDGNKTPNETKWISEPEIINEIRKKLTPISAFEIDSKKKNIYGLVESLRRKINWYK